MQYKMWSYYETWLPVTDHNARGARRHSGAGVDEVATMREQTYGTRVGSELAPAELANLATLATMETQIAEEIQAPARRELQLLDDEDEPANAQEIGAYDTAIRWFQREISEDDLSQIRPADPPPAITTSAAAMRQQIARCYENGKPLPHRSAAVWAQPV